MPFGVSNDSVMMQPPGRAGDEFDDNALIRAARKRILRELEAQQGGGAGVINNNLYGGAGGGMSPGLMERMNGAKEEDPGLYDYLVDIEKRDLPEMNEKGKPIGWTKKVHRHREEKKK